VDAAQAAGDPIEQEMVEAETGHPVLLKEMLADPAESPYEMALHEENRARVERP